CMSTPGTAEHLYRDSPLPTLPSPTSPEESRAGTGDERAGDTDGVADIAHQLQQLVVNGSGPRGTIDVDYSWDFLSSAAQAFGRAPELTQVTAGDLRRGYDMQGYKWQGLEDHWLHYMGYRRSVYPQFQGIIHNVNDVRQQARVPELVNDLYSFRYSALGEGFRSQINHFQLRDLVWATSSYDVFFWHADGVHRWNPWMRSRECIVSRRRMPHGFRLSALCADNGMVFAGDHRGRFFVAPLWDSDAENRYPVSIGKLGGDIINHATPGPSSGGAQTVLAAHNSGFLHTIDAETLQIARSRSFEWAVNSCAQTSDGRMQCVVGDDTAGLVIDARAPDHSPPVARLEGHFDYSFSCAFSPDSRLVATGCQDTAVRVFDMRRPDSALAMFCGHIGAMRSVQFSSCGKFLAAAEPADYVHIYDMHGFSQAQDIELMGEIAGATFSPDSGCLFIGVADALHGSGMIEFNRNLP
ncbi:hypothetical protein LPJ57_000852, partial [Coemansia sp. RSA 486]